MHISMVAPCYSISEDDLKLTIQFFEKLGTVITVPPNLLGEDLLCANSDEIRFMHLEEALNNPSVDIILQLSGGYGLTRLMPRLLRMKKPPKEKLFIGFSDATSLHVVLNQIWNWPSLHGAGAPQIAKKTVGPKTIEATLRIINEGLNHYESPLLYPFNDKARKFSSLSGSVVGGNLSILECSLDRLALQSFGKNSVS